MERSPSIPTISRPGPPRSAGAYPTARDRMTFPELLSQGLEPWNVKEVWVNGNWGARITWSDISDTVETEDPGASGTSLRSIQGVFADIDPGEAPRQVGSSHGRSRYARGIPAHSGAGKSASGS